MMVSKRLEADFSSCGLLQNIERFCVELGALSAAHSLAVAYTVPVVERRVTIVRDPLQ